MTETFNRFKKSHYLNHTTRSPENNCMDLRRLVVEKNQQQQKHRYTIAKGIRTS